MKFLITGGAGFIGSEFIKQAIRSKHRVSVIDKLSYAGDLARLKDVKGRFTFYKTDIRNKAGLGAVFKKEEPRVIVHFAAETHVDRSILGSDEFIKTNISGTQALIDTAKDANIEKFIHISTDEVYGDILKGQFLETTPLNPSSPYSASKAAADLLIRSYIRTFKFPAIIIRPSNNYGPWQYPEKFIPVVIYKALKNEKIPIYGKGENVREWLYVSDCAKAILKTAQNGEIGQTYNLGSGNEKDNYSVANTILDILEKPRSLIEFVDDRLGHDFRYSLNSSKIADRLNWSPETGFEEGLRRTVNWYVKNTAWLETKTRYLRNYWKRVYHR